MTSDIKVRGFSGAFINVTKQRVEQEKRSIDRDCHDALWFDTEDGRTVDCDVEDIFYLRSLFGLCPYEVDNKEKWD